MQIQVREARKEDAQKMLSLYTDFILEFVGPASRDLKTYRRLLRRKDRFYWIAVNGQGEMVGYLLSRFDKRRREGSIGEIIVDPKHNFEQIAKKLADKAYNALIEKNPAMIVAGSIRNPKEEKIFPPLGFLASETTTVFMYSILDTQKFLSELTPILVNRLEKMEEWNGLIEIECDGRSIFIQKTKENVDHIVWSNQPIDFKVSLSRDILMKLIFGIVDPIETKQTGQLKVETARDQTKTNQLLRALFPKKQFLIMDYW